MIYYKTVFQTIFLSHLFVHSQDFLYCCPFMHKPRPQTHLKPSTNQTEQKQKSLQSANDLTKATGGKETGFQVFFFTFGTLPTIHLLSRKTRSPSSQAMTPCGQSRIFVPRGSAERMEPSRETTDCESYTASLDACVSIS